MQLHNQNIKDWSPGWNNDIRKHCVDELIKHLEAPKIKMFFMDMAEKKKILLIKNRVEYDARKKMHM